VPDPSGPPGPATHANGCRGAVMTTAGAVGSERPGLKPRAQSASPLKGAVRRPGARVDRLGAGAVWISRLQPAWGLSPAVHGRAVVERAARLIGAACRARRVGHDALPGRSARAGEAAPRPDKVGQRIPGRADGRHGGATPPYCRGQAVPDPPARQGWQSPDGAMVAVPTGSWTRLTCATGMRRARGAAGGLGRRAPTPVSWRVPGTEPPRGQPSVAGSARS
jgi:hypothetical protein